MKLFDKLLACRECKACDVEFLFEIVLVSQSPVEDGITTAHGLQARITLVYIDAYASINYRGASFHIKVHLLDFMSKITICCICLRSSGNLDLVRLYCLSNGVSVSVKQEVNVYR